MLQTVSQGDRAVMQFLESTILENETNVTLIVAASLTLFLIFSLIPAIKKFVKEKKTNRVIQSLGSQCLKQVILPDGMEGSVFLDYLVLGQNSIILVILKKFRGTIFCAENIDQWTQLIGNRSYKFPNTLQQLDSDILSVSSLVKDVTITGQVVFSNDCDFPKGKPEQVKSLSEISKTEIDKQLHSETLLNAWYRLKELSQNHLSTQSFAENYFKDQDTKISKTFPLIFLFSLMAWLIWRLYFATL